MRTLYHRARLKLGRYGPGYAGKQRFWRDRLAAGYFAATYGPEQLAKSEQIARAVRDHCETIESLHEIGVGGGRNILYLLHELPDVRYSGNDLSWEDCRAHMRPEVAERLEFFEEDTLGFLEGRSATGETVDVLLSADHLIHLPPDAIDRVLAAMTDVAGRYIVLREGVRRSPTRTDDFWFLHDYSPIEERFELVHEEECDPVHFAEYALRIYRRR